MSFHIETLNLCYYFGGDKNQWRIGWCYGAWNSSQMCAYRLTLITVSNSKIIEDCLNFEYESICISCLSLVIYFKQKSPYRKSSNSEVRRGKSFLKWDFVSNFQPKFELFSIAVRRKPLWVSKFMFSFYIFHGNSGVLFSPRNNCVCRVNCDCRVQCLFHTRTHLHILFFYFSLTRIAASAVWFVFHLSPFYFGINANRQQCWNPVFSYLNKNIHITRSFGSGAKLYSIHIS